MSNKGVIIAYRLSPKLCLKITKCFILAGGSRVIMNIALLSGALVNAGDFLITKRSYELLRKVYPNANIFTFVRNYPLSDKDFALMNSCDVIIFGGGPYYKSGFYPDALPADLDELKPKIFMLGGGWWGRTPGDSEIWNCKFSDLSLRLFNRAVKDTGILGCRDNLTLMALKANGFNKFIMTGCPAWYDSGKICTRMKPSHSREINKIVISDPENINLYYGQSLEIAKYLRRRFPEACIKYLFHRGLTGHYVSHEKSLLRNKLKNELEALSITSYDISGGSEGFKLYDDCDIHIGHRVHAHIYNLSQRHASVLIEEDSRGAGVNQTLGLFGIKAYSDFKKGRIISAIERRLRKLPGLSKLELVKNDCFVNSYCINNLDSYLDYLHTNNYKLFDFAFSKMEYYYSVMISHIELIGRAA